MTLLSIMQKTRIWSALPRTTRWQLILAVGLAAGLVEFRLGLATPEMDKPFVEHAGYWLTGGVALLFVLALVEEMRKRWQGWGWLRGAMLQAHWPGLVVGLLGAIFWQVHEPHEFKVLFDEHVLAATAYDMHFEREATHATYSHFINGRIYTFEPILDKRPLLYPFLVSLTHDLTGYRPENSFVVNGLLGALLLLLIYAVGAAMGGWRVGCLGQFLLVGLPLLEQNVTGGGYDLLNATMLCGLLLACWNYWRRPGTEGLELMVITAVLLANCRYESLLYLGVLPVIVVLKWLREKQVTLTWAAALSPLLVTLPLLHNQVFVQDTSNFQTTQENFMNWSHVPDNVAHAISFLFSPDREDENSLLLSGLGAAALLVTVLGIGLRLKKQWKDPGPGMVLLLLVAVVLANSFLMMFLFWGHWDEPIVARFSLPLQLAFAWCILFVTAHMLRGRKLPGLALAAVGIWSVVSAAPVSSRAFATNEPEAYQAYRWARQYVLGHADPMVLVVARSTMMFTLYGRPSVSIGQANVAPEKLVTAKELGVYHDVWVVQEYMINRRLNAWMEYPSARLDQRLILEPVAEYAIHPEIKVRISRVVGYDPKRPAGTVILPGDVGTATVTDTEMPWDYKGEGAQGGGSTPLTERPADQPAAVPTAKELPANMSDLEKMITHQLPGL